MAEKVVSLKATGADGMAYWLAVDSKDVKMTNGKGEVTVDGSGNHILVWWMVGEPGDALSIEGKEGTRIVVGVKETKIPSGSSKGAGYKRFKA